ncbi:TAXI family TRAP transporter solute-binding subunit [Ramlibacter humi]|uniref:C4-dicarboxylate ABC transporter substrate-binding protein n=1 Tax=Ramlibacter humi TaxID=2530451 RepID=A0A4Z0CD06_9BURK|nr:TAXI family TRAP transporter solute-binding subunit [Ramlibacter humi]TFZ08994.1 C4-dicarboxylate ABC transporter substrate-binding protein [Ramlibacter humi]
MPKAIRYTLLSVRDLLVSAGPFAFLAVALLVLAYLWLDPAPPKHVRLATGPAQSAYDEFGKRYQRALAANGIRVELVPSEGSVDNERLLRENRADFAFVQGGTSSGTVSEQDREGIVSMGSLFLEPVWLFYREESAKKKVPTGQLNSLTQLEGMKLNVGTPGSGVPKLMQRLFEANRIDPATLQLSQLEQTPATAAFLSGELDAVVFASAPESLMVQMLLQTPGVKLLDFAQAEAYSRRFAFLSPATLPRGIVDLAQDLPPQNVRLVATTTGLLARAETHPALQQLFAQAARTLHSPAGWFNRARAFPNIENSEYPISREAERVMQAGAPFLQRYLPFWLANLVERMWLALGIIVAVLLPLSRIIPPLYAFRIRSRVFRWYGQLRAIEERGAEEPDAVPQLLKELDEMDQRVAHVAVPLSYADELYALRSNIRLIRNRLAPVA